MRGFRRLRQRRLSQPRLLRGLQRVPRQARRSLRPAVPQGHRRARRHGLWHAGRVDGEPGVRSPFPAALLQRSGTVEKPAAHFQFRAPRLSCRAPHEAHADHAGGALMNIRRVVTEHDAQGRSMVAIDERCTNVISRRPGHQSCLVFTVPDCTIFRIVRYAPRDGKRTRCKAGALPAADANSPLVTASTIIPNSKLHKKLHTAAGRLSPPGTIRAPPAKTEIVIRNSTAKTPDELTALARQM